MHRVELILNKISTIETLNRGESINLINRVPAITSTFNNILRTMIDQWPITPVTEEEVEAVYPVMIKWLENTTTQKFGKASLEHAMRSGLEGFVPFLIVRFLLRNQALNINIRHTTPEWMEFVTLYKPVFDKMDRTLDG